MDRKRSPWPSAETAIATLLLRDWYSSLRLHYVSRLAVAMIVVLIVSFIGTIALFSKPPQFRYIIANEMGYVLPLVPLDQSNQSDEFLIKWTVDAVTRLYSFDFVNHRDQFQVARANLTTQGWKTFEKAMEVSGNFRAVLGNSYVTTAVPTGQGKITKKGDVYGRYAWKVEFPMLISYRSSFKEKDGSSRNTSQQLNMSVTVIRQPEYLNEAGLGVRAIVAE